MSPFELRFAIISTAKEIVENQYKAHMAAWDLMDKATQEAKDLMPKFPTVREVIDVAMEMNKFVSESNAQELTRQSRRMMGM
jgi:MinD superfamily P-loop ATPase